ncbi:hypothetical protein Tco_1544039, partial [Tanacetum coccineum]
MRRQGKDFLRTVTPLFATMLIQSQAVEGEGSEQPTKSQHIPTTASPSHVEPIPTVASSPHPKKTQKHRKTKRKATEISLSSRPTTLIADETVYEERGDSVERVVTTATSLDAEQGSGGSPKRQDTILGDIPAQTRFGRLSKQSNDPPLSRVNTLGSGEDSMKLKELMEICTRLSDRVLALENIKTAQNLEILNLKKRVKKLEKKKKARTLQLKRRLFKVRIEYSAKKSLETQGSAPVTTAGVSVSIAKPSTTPTTIILIKDEDLTIAQNLMKMRSVKSKEKPKEKGVSSETTIRPTRGVIMKEASKTVTRPIVPPQQQLDPKDKGKAMMEVDYELAQRLQAKEQGELTIEERSKLFVEIMDKRKKHFAKLRAEEIK